MPAGLQLFYPDGSINIDTSTGIPRYLGVTAYAWSGQITVPEWATQRPWFIVTSDVWTTSPLRVDRTVAYAQGTSLIWSSRQAAGFTPPRLIYGCY